MPSTKIQDKSDLLTWIKDNKDRERRRNRAIMSEWINNLAAFHSRTDLFVDSDLKMVQRLTAAQRRDLEEITVNWVQPHVRTAAAHLQKSRPMLNVMPVTTDADDIEAAKIGDRFLKAEWEAQRMTTRRIEKSIWMCSIGTGIWHIYFDSSKGELMHGVPVGQIVTETVNPFKVLFEPNRVNHNDCRWAILTQRLPIDEVEAKYGDIFKEQNGFDLQLSGISSDDDNSDPNSFDTEFMSVIGIERSQNDDNGDWVDIDTLYHLPTKRYPQGLYAIVCENQVLYVGAYPYPFLKRLPFCIFKEINCPWRLYGESSATHVLRAQENYTMLRKMERKYLKNFANGKWLVPKGLNIDSEKLISETDRFVSYTSKAGQKPEFIPGQNPPNALNNAMERAKDEASRASGLSEASYGIAPQGVTAGRALLALQEMDATRLGITVELNEKEYASWGQCVLLMAKNFYIEERKYHIAGEAMWGCVESFNASELGNSEDVICQPGSAMPQNRVAKQETAIQFYQLGVFGQPNDPEAMAKLRRILEFGQIEDIHDDDGLDEQKAERENKAILQISQQIATGLSQLGLDISQIPQEYFMQIIPQAAPLENHHVHMRNHVRYYKQAAIQNQSVVAKLIEAHLQSHYMILNPPQQEQPTQQAEQQQEQLPEQQTENIQPLVEEQAQQMAENQTNNENIQEQNINNEIAIENPISRNDLQLNQSDYENALRTQMEH